LQALATIFSTFARIPNQLGASKRCHNPLTIKQLRNWHPANDPLMFAQNADSVITGVWELLHLLQHLKW
jgi:hypothetical protein